MKKVLALFLSGLLVLALSSCGSGTAKPDGSSNSGSKSETGQSSGTMQNTATQGKVKIEITPPSGWDPVEGSVLPVQYMKGTASFMVKEESMFAAKTPDDVVTEAKGYFEKSFKNVSYEGETKTLTVDGKDARQMVFSCTVGNLKMKYEYAYLFVGGKVYAITFGDSADSFDSLSADYEQILKDIRFQ